MKRMLPRILAVGLSAIALVSSVVAFSIAWFTSPGGSTDKETLDGEVGLRGYFYTGNGTKDNPFEIVSPIHFYNLTRLQNLGVFTLKKTYFQVGHYFDNDTDPSCLNIVNGVQVKQPWLDMESFCATNTLLPIGGEGAPFVGEFDGQGLPIKNLKISGYPEDIGVFGYVSYGGVVRGLVCEDLEVVSLGYTKSQSDPSNALFGQDIDDIFSAESDYLATETSLSFTNNNELDAGKKTVQLKEENGTSGKHYTHINSDDNTLTNNKYIFNGYFLPTWPTGHSDPFTYSWKSSSEVLKKATPEMKAAGLAIADSDIDNAVVVDMTALANSTGENGFNNPTQNMQVDARLSLIASVQIGGFTYSRVIQSYKIEFYSNSLYDGEVPEDYDPYDVGNYEMSIFCDYVDKGATNDIATNYHHGNNIGFLAGHVDGTIEDSYVYKGSLKFNDENANEPIETESETGLVGEIGTNVANSLDADLGLTTNGDTGIVNFTKIFNNIRGSFEGGEQVYGGYYATGNVPYVTYNSIKNTEKYGLFKDYLCHMSDGEPITSVVLDQAPNIRDYDTSLNESELWHKYTIPSSNITSFNSVDIIWNSIIQDDLENNKDRGLGVFKIVSTHVNVNTSSPTYDYSNYIYTNIGKTRISNDNTRYDKVYFSTAEFDHTQGDSPSWGTGVGQITPLRATTLPSYSTKESFKYPFSRDYNYCFELDLSRTEDLGSRNYMYNTNSQFLLNYLSSILIDKYGGQINPKSNRFGFMFRSDDNEKLNYLSSYMNIGVPGKTVNFGTNQNPECYPENSLVFRIDNKNGANVSVVGTGADISIYSYDPTVAGVYPEKKYTMYSKSKNTNYDTFRYFEYNINGQTDTTAKVLDTTMTDSGKLYGHIFKLPEGDYVIGASSGTAKLYYLAVQGQTNATIGDYDIASVGSAITRVDFLTEPPTYADFKAGTLSLAKFLFRSNQNFLENKAITVDIKTVNDKKYINLKYSEENNPVFITYLLLSCTSLEHGTKYYVNDVAHTEGGTYVLI